jgi:hypothetical protein
MSLDKVVTDGEIVKEGLVVNRLGGWVQGGIQQLLCLLRTERLSELSEILKNKVFEHTRFDSKAMSLLTKLSAIKPSIMTAMINYVASI